MAETFDIVFKGGTVVNQDGEGLADIGVRDGKIRAIGDIGEGLAGETIDARGLHILPGVIDSQVHFREPGMEHKEDLETGSRSAVLGGVTAVFEMPNTKPPTTSAEALKAKVDAATDRMHCDFAFFIGATRENIDELAELERLPGAAGVKVFAGSSTGDLLVDDEESLARMFATIRRRASFHSECESRLKERVSVQREGDPASHTEWRDPIAAIASTERLLRLATDAGSMPPVHGRRRGKETE